MPNETAVEETTEATGTIQDMFNEMIKELGVPKDKKGVKDVKEAKEGKETKETKESKEAGKEADNKAEIQKPKDKETAASEEQPDNSQRAAKEAVVKAKADKAEAETKEIQSGKEVDGEDITLKIKNLEKELIENHKYGRRTNQKIKDALKIVDLCVDDGEIDEETAGKLYTVLKAEDMGFAEKGSFADNIIPEEKKHPLNKYEIMVNAELFQNYLDVTEDKDAPKKLQAFSAYVNECGQEEIEELDAQLSECKTPMAVLRKFLSLGDKFLQEGMKEFYEHGGFRKFLAAKKKEIDKLQKEVDKLNKKLSEYESTETSGKFWLSSDSRGSANAFRRKDSGDMLTDMLAEEEYERKREK